MGHASALASRVPRPKKSTKATARSPNPTLRLQGRGQSVSRADLRGLVVCQRKDGYEAQWIRIVRKSLSGTLSAQWLLSTMADMGIGG